MRQALYTYTFPWFFWLVVFDCFAATLLGEKGFDALGQSTVKGWCLRIAADPVKNELQVGRLDLKKPFAFVAAEGHPAPAVIGSGVFNCLWLAGKQSSANGGFNCLGSHTSAPEAPDKFARSVVDFPGAGCGVQEQAEQFQLSVCEREAGLCLLCDRRHGRMVERLTFFVARPRLRENSVQDVWTPQPSGP